MSKKNPYFNLVRMWHHMIFRIFRAAVKKPLIFVIPFFLILGASFIPLKNLKMLISIDELVDPDFKTYQQLKSLNDNFLDQDEIFIVIKKQRRLIFK